MRRTPLVTSAVILGLLPFLAPGPARGQIVEVPTFPIGTGGVVPFTPDVAVGTDGTLVFLWMAPATPQTAVTGHFSPTGSELRPPERVDMGGHVREVALSATPQGGYIAAWHWRIPNQRSSYFGRRLDTDGIGIGSEFEIVPNAFPVLPRPPAVAALPSGSVFLWTQDGFLGRLYDPAGNPRGAPFDIGSFGYHKDVAALPDGGFIVVWWSDTGIGPSLARLYDGSGIPRGDAFKVSDDFIPYAVAVNPLGTLVVAGVGSSGDGFPAAIWMRRFTHAGIPVGNSVLVYLGALGENLEPDVGIDLQDNVYVAWAGFQVDPLHFSPIRGRAYDAADIPLGPPFDVANVDAPGVHVARTQSGDFVTTWTAAPEGGAANIVSLCTPGISVCGDGILNPQCERCDDGVANSDTTPDACRSDCQPAHCTDGVVDSGEECDDGNTRVCDGCTPRCTLEAGIVCGDGITQPNCAEQCDDANTTVGDGCSPRCALERIPGGGAPKSDCYSEWSMDNPANQPLLDKKGAFNCKQRCVDDDPRCDFDGGMTGSCTFHVRVCANNTGLASCSPPSRLASWELVKPSATQAAKTPAYAAVRAAFASVPGAIVGPSTTDLCSPTVAVTVPLRGVPGAYASGKLTLRTRAETYEGISDADKLQLTCLPAP